MAILDFVFKKMEESNDQRRTAVEAAKEQKAAIKGC